VVNDCGLAYCRPNTVNAEDCIPYDRIDGSTGGEGTFLKPNDKQEWQWVSGQTCDELSLFQSWDSSTGGFQGTYNFYGDEGSLSLLTRDIF